VTHKPRYKLQFPKFDFTQTEREDQALESLLHHEEILSEKAFLSKQQAQSVRSLFPKKQESGLRTKVSYANLQSIGKEHLSPSFKLGTGNSIFDNSSHVRERYISRFDPECEYGF